MKLSDPKRILNISKWAANSPDSTWPLTLNCGYFLLQNFCLIYILIIKHSTVLSRQNLTALVFQHIYLTGYPVCSQMKPHRYIWCLCTDEVWLHTKHIQINIQSTNILQEQKYKYHWNPEGGKFFHLHINFIYNYNLKLWYMAISNSKSEFLSIFGCKDGLTVSKNKTDVFSSHNS